MNLPEVLVQQQGEEEEGASLSLELAKKARAELNEDPCTVAEELATFRESVEAQAGLDSRRDSAFLLRFLRARKFRQGPALELLRNYYLQRKKYPDIYENLLASSMPEALSSNQLGFLPHPDHLGRPVYVFNTAGLWNPRKLPVDDIIRYCLLSLERVIQSDRAQVNGVVCLLDARGFGLTHVRHSSPFAMSKIISVTLNSFPARFKELHVVNEPIMFDLVFALMKPFLGKKLKDRFFFHGCDVSSLLQHFPAEILPQEFGGSLGPFSNADWNQQLLDNDSSAKADAHYGFVAETTPP